jgi:hypothetical protein
MATRWMEQKLAKMKRDGMADTRGPYNRFKDKPGEHSPSNRRAPGWYAYGTDKRAAFGTVRVLPRAVGPFGSESEARAMARKMFDNGGAFLAQ